MKYGWSAKRKRFLRLLLVASLCIIAGFPTYWLINTAGSTRAELFGAGQGAGLHFPSLLSSLSSALNTQASQWLLNSIIVASGTTIASLLLASLMAYSLSRFRYVGRGFVSLLLFATQMLPEALLVVPLYSMFVVFGLINNLGSLVIANTAFAMPVAVWIIKASMDDIPIEIEEAARVDGCSRLRLFGQIVLPLTLPSIAASAVIVFLEGWNEFLFATTFIQDANKWPASVGLSSFIGEFITPLPTVFGVAIVFTIPAVVFFLFVQKWIVGGLTSGAVKG